MKKTIDKSQLTDEQLQMISSGDSYSFCANKKTKEECYDAMICLWNSKKNYCYHPLM